MGLTRDWCCYLEPILVSQSSIFPVPQVLAPGQSGSVSVLTHAPTYSSVQSTMVMEHEGQVMDFHLRYLPAFPQCDHFALTLRHRLPFDSSTLSTKFSNSRPGPPEENIVIIHNSVPSSSVFHLRLRLHDNRALPPPRAIHHRHFRRRLLSYSPTCHRVWELTLHLSLCEMHHHRGSDMMSLKPCGRQQAIAEHRRKMSPFETLFHLDKHL